jgi:hypothetical protein
MASIKRGLKYLLRDRAHFCDSLVVKLLGFLPDKPYLSLRYRCNVGHWMSWSHPRTFTEKLQWLKVYGFRPEYTRMVDKYAVKDYVAGIIGQEHIIPTLGVWNRPEDIDWDSLPSRFVLKTTHGGGGGGVVICKDKATFNRQAAIEKLANNMKGPKKNSYREHPYDNVPRRIIAEQYMEETVRPEVDDLIDYKFYCFNGEPKLVMVAGGRQKGNKRFGYYDTKWNPVHITWGAPRPDVEFERPTDLGDMLKIAAKLSAGLVHARIDLYNINLHVYFGEITFFDASGFAPISPESYDAVMGSWMQLTENKQNKSGGGKLVSLIAGEIAVADVQPGGDLMDYKFYCFNGEPRYCQVIRDRRTKETIDFYDMQWNHMPFVGLNPVGNGVKPVGNGVKPVGKPLHLEEMQRMCRALSKNIPFSRVDLYNISEQVYFGEITFYPASGFGVFTPDEWNGKLGEMITL